MNLFLSRAFVDYELAFKRGLRDAYRWHQAVWEAFPGRDRAQRDFLTRVDIQDRGFQVLILSAVAPVKPDWCPTEQWETKPIPDRFWNHKRYAFQLRANPTKKIADPAKPKAICPDGRINRNRNARRVPLLKREALVAWLQRKADAGGFRFNPDTLSTHPARKEFFWKPRNGERAQARPGVVQGVEFHGVLEVIDRGRFLQTFRSGVGSAKAFGFGLLLLAPLGLPQTKTVNETLVTNNETDRTAHPPIVPRLVP
jgi:CRISPR system Cascade subunit CasE